MKRVQATPRRLEFPGARYHVRSREIVRGDIIREDAYRHDFIKTLAEACAQTIFEIHARCLLSPESRRGACDGHACQCFSIESFRNPTILLASDVFCFCHHLYAQAA